MLPSDIIKKIRRIEITTNRLVTDIFAGQYHSVFKGRGMEFDEVREYQPGDDIRSIDWNVTARTGTPHVKKYIEERELTVMLMVDASASCRFATRDKLKSQLAAEIAAVLAFSAIRNHDKVGALFFTDRVEKFIPPRKGSSHVLRLIREILYFEPEGRGTDIEGALQYLNRVVTRRCVGFMISDFLTGRDPLEEPVYKQALSAAARRHDLIAVSLNDPAEEQMTGRAVVRLRDAETGGRVVVDSRDRNVQQAFAERSRRRRSGQTRFFRSLGMDEIRISTDGVYADEIVKFFLKRRKRK